jgi:hypothetical protein
MRGDSERRNKKKDKYKDKKKHPYKKGGRNRLNKKVNN